MFRRAGRQDMLLKYGVHWRDGWGYVDRKRIIFVSEGARAVRCQCAFGVDATEKVCMPSLLYTWQLLERWCDDEAAHCVKGN